MESINRYSFHLSLSITNITDFDEAINKTIKEQYIGKVYKYGIVKKFDLIRRGFVEIDSRGESDWYVVPVCVDFTEVSLVKNDYALFQITSSEVQNIEGGSIKNVRARYISDEFNIYANIVPMKVSSKMKALIENHLDNVGDYITCKVVSDPAICMSLNFTAYSVIPSGKITPIYFKGDSKVKLPDFKLHEQYKKYKFVSKLFELVSGTMVKELKDNTSYAMDPFGVYETSKEDINFLRSDQLQKYINNYHIMMEDLLRLNSEYTEKSKSSLNLLDLFDKI